MKNQIKKLPILLFLIGYSIGLIAQKSRFKENENVYVWATSGLNMRALSDAKSPKMGTIPYGTKITVLPDIGVKVPFEVEEFKGFVVKGYWLLVKYGDTEGFVFDGFLSRLPAPKHAKNGLKTYLDNNLAKDGGQFDIQVYSETLKKVILVSKVEPKDKEKTSGYSQKYKEGVFYKGGTGNEIGYNEHLEIPNISLFEGYFLVNYFYKAETTLGTGNTVTFDKKTNIISFQAVYEGGGCGFSIEKKGNKIILDGGCGC